MQPGLAVGERVADDAIEGKLTPPGELATTYAESLVPGALMVGAHAAARRFAGRPPPMGSFSRAAADGRGTQPDSIIDPDETHYSPAAGDDPPDVTDAFGARGRNATDKISETAGQEKSTAATQNARAGEGEGSNLPPLTAALQARVKAGQITPALAAKVEAAYSRYAGAAAPTTRSAEGLQERPRLPAYNEDDGTFGIFRTEAGDVPFRSGRRGPALAMLKGTAGFNMYTKTHVEGHAAAWMRLHGIERGTLYINNPTICSRCTSLLERMLPFGAQLDVVLPSGEIVPFKGTFRQ